MKLLHKPRRFWRGFRRGYVRGLVLVTYFATAFGIIGGLYTTLLTFIQTGKTSLAIILFSLIFLAGMLAIAFAISRLKFTNNTTLHVDYMEVSTPTSLGRAAAQMAARKH